MKRSLKLLAIAVAAAALAAGCAETCNDNRNALPRAGFYVAVPGGEPQQVSIDSLQVIGVGMRGDSALLAPGGGGTDELYLPFRIDCDSTAYVFINARKGGGQSDTVTFRYVRQPRFVSAECGVSYRFEMQSISSQGVLIDSVVCPKGYIDNKNKENLLIYFRNNRAD